MADTDHSGTSITGGHANAVAGGAAGFLSGTDKTKLDGIASGAQVCSAANVITALAAAASDIAINTHKVTGVQAGTAADHAINKAQLDAHDQIFCVVAVNAAPGNTTRTFAQLGVQTSSTTEALGCLGAAPWDMVVTGFEVVVAGSALATDTIAITIRDNGSDTSVTGTLAAAGTALTSTGTASFTKGHKITLALVQSASEAQANMRMRFVIYFKKS